MVVTRFAPSPTGNLHIGSLRTALFNWLYARHNGGSFHVRIEDTDRVRSEDKYLSQIFSSMAWLGIDMDSEPVLQHQKADRHREVANTLLEKGAAYKCFATAEELEKMREEQTAQGKPSRYDRRWRDRDPSEYPADRQPVIRLKLPIAGETVINDRVKGVVKINNSELDDFVLVRSDGNPTYMLSVVVDDYDLGVTHVIRGDDHFTNTFRQHHIYKSMGWETPEFAHFPLILDMQGRKLSKRRGATSVNEYIDEGYLPQGFMNFLLRMGWGHKDQEIFTTQEAVDFFDVSGLGKAPAKFDIGKLSYLSGHFLKQMPIDDVMENVAQRLNITPTHALYGEIKHILPEFITRSSTFSQIARDAGFLIESPVEYEEKAGNLIRSGNAVLKGLLPVLESLPTFSKQEIEAACREQAEVMNVKLVDIAMPLRAAIAGRTISPPIFDVCQVIGAANVAARINMALEKFPQSSVPGASIAATQPPSPSGL